MTKQWIQDHCDLHLKEKEIGIISLRTLKAKTEKFLDGGFHPGYVLKERQYFVVYFYMCQ